MGDDNSISDEEDTEGDSESTKGIGRFDLDLFMKLLLYMFKCICINTFTTNSFSMLIISVYTCVDVN